MKLRNSVVIAIACGLLTLTYSQQAVGQVVDNFRLEITPVNPDDLQQVAVKVSGEFGSTCIELCDAIGEWITPSEFHIDWYVHDRSLDPNDGTCIPVILTLSSEFPLGSLSPAEYLVTGTRYTGIWDVACTEGDITEQIQTTFQVTPNVPAVSQWGLIILVLSLIITGSILLHKRAKLIS